MVDIRCYINAGDRFSKDLMVKNCKCLPDCTAITYDIEISQTPMQYFNSDDDISHWNSQNVSRYEIESNRNYQKIIIISSNFAFKKIKSIS